MKINFFTQKSAKFALFLNFLKKMKEYIFVIETEKETYFTLLKEVLNIFHHPDFSSKIVTSHLFLAN